MKARVKYRFSHVPVDANLGVLLNFVTSDAGTSKKIFDGLIDSSRGSILSNSAIILVTHAAHFLNRVDNILVIVEGKARFFGTWLELFEYDSDDVKTKDVVDFIRSSVQEESEDLNKDSGKEFDANDETKRDQKEEDGRLMTVETKEYGLSDLRTWLLWFRHAGGLPFLIVQFLLQRTQKTLDHRG